VAKKPFWLGMIIRTVVNFFLNNEAEGIKKFKPMITALLSVLITIVIWVFDPELLNQILKFLVSLI
jgi:hypothetical protein